MLIQLTTEQQITESEFRNDHPNIAFPAVLSDELLRTFGYTAIIDTMTPSETETHRAVIDGIEQKNGAWYTKWVMVDKSEEELSVIRQQLITNCTAHVQQRLDTFAQSKQYDTILAAASYADIQLSSPPLPMEITIQREGNYAKNIRVATWIAYYNYIASASPIKFSDLEQVLPKLEWPSV